MISIKKDIIQSINNAIIGEKSIMEFRPKDVLSSRLRIGESIGSVICNISFTNILFFGIGNHYNIARITMDH